MLFILQICLNLMQHPQLRDYLKDDCTIFHLVEKLQYWEHFHCNAGRNFNHSKWSTVEQA